MCNRTSQQEAFFVGCGVEEINISRSPTWAQNRIPFAAISGHIHKSIDYEAQKTRKGFTTSQRHHWMQIWCSFWATCTEASSSSPSSTPLNPSCVSFRYFIRSCVYSVSDLFPTSFLPWHVLYTYPQYTTLLVAGEEYFTNSRYVVICATNSATLCLQIEIIWPWYSFTRER